MRVAQDPEHRRQDQVLLLDVEREDPRQVGADGDEADVAERQHAGVADEDVDRDDDRDVDEGVAELELAHRVQLRADRRHRDDEQRPGRRAPASASSAAAHTRSAAVARRPAKRPLGRTRITRITRP